MWIAVALDDMDRAQAQWAVLELPASRGRRRRQALSANERARRLIDRRAERPTPTQVKARMERAGEQTNSALLEIRCRRSSQMSLRERHAGTGLQILLESDSPFFVGELDDDVNLPRAAADRVRHVPALCSVRRAPTVDVRPV
jgi:hypothetical protein